MAHKKGQGAGKNGRDSNPQYRGVKKFGGQQVFPGTILVRQCGSHFRSGFNVGCGKDYTIYSLIEGVVKFESQRRISVYPVQK